MKQWQDIIKRNFSMTQTEFLAFIFIPKILESLTISIIIGWQLN